MAISSPAHYSSSDSSSNLKDGSFRVVLSIEAAVSVPASKDRRHPEGGSIGVHWNAWGWNKNKYKV